jgi:hypothetical protein
MSGLTATSQWTDLVGGFVLAGFGSGLVNPPLASTAVGVVPPHRSGMASGVNTTFRQIGIAAGIAAYGTLFASRLTAELGAHLAAIPGLAGHAAEVSTAIRSGTFGQTLAGAPPAERGALVHAATASFASGMNEILVVSAVLAGVAGMASLALIRGRDFVVSSAGPPGEPGAPGSPESEPAAVPG